jgi:hypothetical protein
MLLLYVRILNHVTVPNNNKELGRVGSLQGQSSKMNGDGGRVFPSGIGLPH